MKDERKRENFKNITKEHIEVCRKLIKSEIVNCDFCPFSRINSTKNLRCYEMYEQDVSLCPKGEGVHQLAQTFIDAFEKDFKEPTDKCGNSVNLGGKDYYFRIWEGDSFFYFVFDDLQFRLERILERKSEIEQGVMINGIEVYENDIMSFDDFYDGDTLYRKENVLVKFDECSFYGDGLNEEYYDLRDLIINNNGKVIGNIHNNPELMESKYKIGMKVICENNCGWDYGEIVDISKSAIRVKYTELNDGRWYMFYNSKIEIDE